jgi:predicted NUDIX family NTP pyrophosphohydrolase
MPTSAGLLMYRVRDGELQLLLAHPGGPFFANKDDGVWTIPKGMPDDPAEDLLECAKREFREETGLDLGPGPFLPLGSVKQKGGKTVHAWAFEGDCDPSRIVSNTFRVQWPYKSGKWITVPEVDRAAFFGVAEALQKINPAQAAFVTHLADAIAK